MLVTNEVIASKISRKTYGIPKTIEEYCYQLLIEEIFVPKDKSSYSEQELKTYIIDYFNKNSIEIKGEM